MQYQTMYRRSGNIRLVSQMRMEGCKSKSTYLIAIALDRSDPDWEHRYGGSGDSRILTSWSLHSASGISGDRPEKGEKAVVGVERYLDDNGLR